MLSGFFPMLVAGSAALAILSAPVAAAEKYEFFLAVKSGDVVDGKVLNLIAVISSGKQVALNDSGALVFKSAFCPPPGPCLCPMYSCKSGIFTATVPFGAQMAAGTALVAGSGSVISGKTLTLLPGGVAVNNAGLIVFDSYFVGTGPNEELGLFTPSQLLAGGGSVISNKTLLHILPGWASVNDLGMIVFTARYDNGGTASSGIFSPTQMLVSSGQEIDGSLLTSVASPLLTNNLRLVFWGGFSEGGLNMAGLFTPFERLVKADVASDSFAMNDDGDIIFTSGPPSALYAIKENGHKKRLDLLAGGGQPVAGYTDYGIQKPLIDASGTVVFQMQLSLTGTISYGIFTPKRRIIGPGDVVSGKTVANFVRLEALSDRGRMALLTSFTDGTYGIVIGDPKR